MTKFIGITIGPIADTIMDASSPAALWFASSLFSDLVRRLCVGIKDKFKDARIYSPYFASDIPIDDGVGKFHDRVIFSTKYYESMIMKDFIKNIKSETINNFPKEFSGNSDVFFEQYFQIHYVALDEIELQNKNCILALSPYLDALELMKTFPKDDSKNIIRKLFSGEENGGNIFIKNSYLFKQIKSDRNQLKKNNDCIWRIDEIASDHNKITERLKRKDYYAVVQADGDGMGKFLEKLNNETVTDFSEACLNYDEKVSKMIGDYGGMTIYAGGDDLLFLAPIINIKGKSIFELCKDIREKFQEKIMEPKSLKKNTCIPTVSFGIAIQYKKYPLYEALARSRDLLGLAKNDKTEKDKMVIDILKHSGNNLKVMVSNISYPILEKIMKLEREEDEKMVNSAIYTLEIFKSIIYVMNTQIKNSKMSETAYETAFMNLFDNVEQKPAENYLKNICNIYLEYFVFENSKITIPNDKEQKGCNSDNEKDLSLKTYLQLLKIKKFLIEKEGKEY